MNQPLRFGPVPQITGETARVFCSANVMGAAHASAFVVNRETWGLLLLNLPGKTHFCRSPARRGCSAASTLRAVGLAMSSRAPGTNLVVYIIDHEVLNLLRQWQAGDLEQPVWYTGGPNGSQADLARLVAKATSWMTVARPPAQRCPEIVAAKNMASAGTQIVRPSLASNALDLSLTSILQQLPRLE